MKWADSGRKRMHDGANSLGNLMVEGFHYFGLFAIGAATAWASVMAFMGMVDKGQASIDDILLLFIYLELGAMVGIYFKNNTHVTNISIRAYSCSKDEPKQVLTA